MIFIFIFNDGYVFKGDVHEMNDILVKRLLTEWLFQGSQVREEKLEEVRST